MRNLFLVSILFFSLLSCKDRNEDPKPQTELEKLPEATRTGKNTAGCLVNGTAFLPKGYLNIGNLNCNYTDGKDFNIRISEKINNDIRSIYVFNNNQQLVQGQTYILKQETNDSGFGTYILNAEASPSPNYYSTNSTITGELKITYHNFDQAILSGTFWFDAVNSNGDKVQVREGRFDMHY